MTQQNGSGWDTLTHDIEGWWRPAEGQVIIGRIVGTLVSKDLNGGPRLIYVLETVKPCMAYASGEDAPSNFDAGSTIGLTETGAMRKIRQYVVHQGLVAIKCLGKIKLDGGRTMWKLDIKAKGQKAPLPNNLTAADTTPNIPTTPTPDSSFTPSDYEETDDFNLF